MVALDTSSVITRPPTPLLAKGIAAALRRDRLLAVAILPGYTDVNAAPRLEQALLPVFPERVFLLVLAERGVHLRPPGVDFIAFLSGAQT